jgi:hypothetical protein
MERGDAQVSKCTSTSNFRIKKVLGNRSCSKIIERKDGRNEGTLNHSSLQCFANKLSSCIKSKVGSRSFFSLSADIISALYKIFCFSLANATSTTSIPLPQNNRLLF